MRTSNIICFTSALLLLVVVPAKPTVITDEEKINISPIIGVVVKEISSPLEEIYPGKYNSFIEASHVKFVEGGGGRVIPVWLGQDQKYYEDIVKKTNGILFTSGDTHFNDKCGSADASVTLYKLALEENKRGNYYPIFSFGQGMETLMYAATNKSEVHIACSTTNVPDSLDFKPDSIKSSKLYALMPSTLSNALQNENITISIQLMCLTEQKLADLKLTDDWRVLSTNKDKKHGEFISSLEHKKYPFYAVQFRPQMYLYEWKAKRFEFSFNAIFSSQYFAAFFVNEARKNNKIETAQPKLTDFIYNYPVTYTKKDGYNYDLTYLFGADKGTTC